MYDYVNYHLYGEVLKELDIHSIQFYHNIRIYVLYILLQEDDFLI